MAASNSTTTVIAALGGAAVALAAVWLARGSGEPPASPALPPAAEAAAAPAPTAAAARAAALPQAATVDGAEAPTATGAFPEAPEVGEVIPEVPPALRVPGNKLEIARYVEDVASTTGPAEDQRRLASARWTFDVAQGPLAGRLVVELDDKAMVARTTSGLVFVAEAQGRCTSAWQGGVFPCDGQELRLVDVIRAGVTALLPAAWSSRGLRFVGATLHGGTSQVELRGSASLGADAKHPAVRVEGRTLHVGTWIGGAAAVAFDAPRRFGALTLPSTWTPRCDGATLQEDAKHAAEAPRPPSATAAPRAFSAVEQAIAQAQCEAAAVVLLAVEPAAVQVPTLAVAAAENAWRREERAAMSLLAVAVQRVDDIPAANEALLPARVQPDRSRLPGVLMVGKDGLASCFPYRGKVEAQAATVVIEAGPVVRSRRRIVPTMLVAEVQRLAEEARREHKLGGGPWLAWPLEIPPGAVPGSKPLTFEVELPVVP